MGIQGWGVNLRGAAAESGERQNGTDPARFVRRTSSPSHGVVDGLEVRRTVCSTDWKSVVQGKAGLSFGVRLIADSRYNRNRVVWVSESIFGRACNNDIGNTL